VIERLRGHVSVDLGRDGVDRLHEGSDFLRLVPRGPLRNGQVRKQ
jgi:hypothetical protein